MHPLEEALCVRLDFRWLAEGRTIDHTTLSTFRKQHPEARKNLFVQIGLVACELGGVAWPVGGGVKKKYAARGYRGERPFAQIKHHFGARQFLLRGLKKVRIEWTWLVSAFNLRTLMTLIQARPEP